MTAREEQVLSRFAQGLTVEEIAASIGIGARVVGAVLTNILQKLHELTLFERVLAKQAGANGR
jgi:DNA-binding CsgD family transcriptional regulator